MQEPASTVPKRRQHSLATDLVTELSQRILLGKIAPGQKLPSENQIVREHGVSRTVVREAISNCRRRAGGDPSRHRHIRARAQ